MIDWPRFWHRIVTWVPSAIEPIAAVDVLASGMLLLLFWYGINLVIVGWGNELTVLQIPAVLDVRIGRDDGLIVGGERQGAPLEAQAHERRPPRRLPRRSSSLRGPVIPATSRSC